MAKKILREEVTPVEGNLSQAVDCTQKPRSRKKTASHKTVYENIKIVATNTAVPFPSVPLPYGPDWEDQLKIFEEAAHLDTHIYLVPLVDPHLKPSLSNLNRIAVGMKVVKVIDLPEGRKNVFLLGEQRVKIAPLLQTSESVFEGSASICNDYLIPGMESKFDLTMKLVEETYDYVKGYFSEISNVQMAPPRELMADSRTYLNFIIVTSPIEFTERVEMLNEDDRLLRAEKALVALEKVKQQIDLRKEIFSRAAADMDREQRDHFLRTQIRQIQNEIGEGTDSDASMLEERARKKNWSDDAMAHFAKELSKLNRFPYNSPDYSIQYNYLETLLNLPWDNFSQSYIDLAKLEKDLDRDHYGMKKIKERIVEHMAVLKLKGDMRSPILCLYGPPGVGKTSLCKSIADSIGREYSRISLGGLHDETEIRGHRRTYIGALPGRIITALGKMETNDPVFVLDEIDKIGNDHRGDPSQALLEVLDPEQNTRFHDNYLDTDYDLSKIFFIATANSLSTISRPLLDRMELIEVTGYLPEEKIEIAKRHLVPKQLENHGFGKKEVKFTDDAIATMIDSYTRESGVRKLEKTIAAVLRKIAVAKAKGERFPKKIDAKKARLLLGKEDILPEIYEGNLPVGVTAGLAWTATGGEILYFESSLSQGKGNLTLTGNLGDVMKESATIALQWIKANSEKLGIDPERFGKTDIHLHVPEGAVPKDGPSAGITMVSSMTGAFTNRRSRDGVAMTGEVTLSGKVLPVGGIKEKILAARRAGITDIILSEKNRPDIIDIEPEYVEGLVFHYVRTIPEVLVIALEEGSE